MLHSLLDLLGLLICWLALCGLVSLLDFLVGLLASLDLSALLCSLDLFGCGWLVGWLVGWLELGSTALLADIVLSRLALICVSLLALTA